MICFAAARRVGKLVVKSSWSLAVHPAGGCILASRWSPATGHRMASAHARIRRCIQQQSGRAQMVPCHDGLITRPDQPLHTAAVRPCPSLPWDLSGHTDTGSPLSLVTAASLSPAAASNNDVTVTYPANYAVDNVIAVGSIDSLGGISGFSNFGECSSTWTL